MDEFLAIFIFAKEDIETIVLGLPKDEYFIKELEVKSA